MSNFGRSRQTQAPRDRREEEAVVEFSRRTGAPGWRRRLLWLLLLSCGYLGGLLLALSLAPDLIDKEAYFGVMRHWPLEGGPVFPGSQFGTWDAAHYLCLSERGYTKDLPSCAFYPLWPLLMRWFSVFTGGNHVISGMLLANVFSIAGLALFFRLVEERFGSTKAWLASSFLFLFPGSLFFHFVYSEALFFLLLMLFVLGLEQRRYGWVWAAGFLLPMTRALGVFCVVPLLWHGVRKHPLGWRDVASKEAGSEVGSGGGSGYESRAIQTLERPSGALDQTRCVWHRMRQLAGFVAVVGSAPLLGYALYFGLMWHWTGNPWEGFQAQRFWGYVHSISNLWDVPKFVIGFFTPTTWHAFRGSVLDRCVFVALLYSLPVIWKLDKGWFIWALVLGVVPAMSGTFTSFTRFASVIFPMFIALGVVFADPRLRWWRYGLLSVFAALHVILVWRFVNFRWAG